MTELDVALHAVERLRAWKPRAEDHAFVESVEVVSVDGHVGLDVRWTQVTSDQGRRCFGLLTTLQELMEDADTYDGDFAVQALLFAVQEPHASPSVDVRLVFRHLP